MARILARMSVLVVIVLVLCNFAAAQESSSIPAPGTCQQTKPLRVGITPNYPPVIFKQNNAVVGVEAELAYLLGKELNRPVWFIELTKNDQIPALLDGDIDIIMSGVSVTDIRKVRISFTEPYLKGGLFMAMRLSDTAKYDSLNKVMGTYLTVGFVGGTTGEAWARKNMARLYATVTLPDARSAVEALKTKRIDIFVHDAPSVVWLVSENESVLGALWQVLDVEFLAWGVRIGDQALLTQANTALRKWKSDGTLQAILDKWMPYWRKLEQTGAEKKR
jgi:ABC-type amino acid transport substrate-binding protein